MSVDDIVDNSQYWTNHEYMIVVQDPDVVNLFEIENILKIGVTFFFCISF